MEQRPLRLPTGFIWEGKVSCARMGGFSAPCDLQILVTRIGRSPLVWFALVLAFVCCFLFWRSLFLLLKGFDILKKLANGTGHPQIECTCIARFSEGKKEEREMAGIMCSCFWLCKYYNFGKFI